MTPAERDLRYYAALGLAAEASHLALGYFNKRESLGITMKGAQDWLTVADGEVEEFLRQRLSELFPNDSVIGEEGGGEASDAVWILDPIDGTANFARGDRNWCISIGFLADRRPEIGVVAAWPGSDADGDRHVAWVREGWESLRPYASGVYANFLSDEGDEGLHAAFGERLGRLRGLKDRYDPTNVFRLNANIPPSR